MASNGWYVIVGKGLYLVGLNTQWPEVGYIFSKIESRAKVFVNLDQARKTAEGLGGIVVAA